MMSLLYVAVFGVGGLWWEFSHEILGTKQLKQRIDFCLHGFVKVLLNKAFNAVVNLH